MRIKKIFKEFMENEKSGGLVLILCTIISLTISNSTFGTEYMHFWHLNIGGESVEYWINDGLMAVFFLLVGLELKRELNIGQLSNIKQALLPVFAALGGMFVPAAIYLAFNWGTMTQSGSGIPMATDIAFALGILSLLGKKVPLSLKVFLTAFAVIDDLGAILVIALFYTNEIIWFNLLISAAILVALLTLNKLKIKKLFIYLLLGIAMWYFMLHSGIHATITGVLLAFTIPFENGHSKAASYKLQHFLHKWVAYLVLPVFALANTAIVLNGDFSNIILQNYSLGIFLGLILGKPIGIMLFSVLAVKIGICRLPKELNWKLIGGAGMLGGIGFTMSIFIALLAFNSPEIIANAKLVVLLSSVTAAIIGLFTLNLFLKKT